MPRSSPMPRTSPISSWRLCSSRKPRGEVVAHLAAARRAAVPARSSRAPPGRPSPAADRRRATCRTRSRALWHVSSISSVVIDAGERHAAAQRLRHGQDVGRHVQMRRGEPVAEASERGLRLVEDQQHARACALRPAQRVEVAVGRNDDAAGADDRLGDHRRRRAGRLHVVQLEADLHARAVAACRGNA